MNVEEQERLTDAGSADRRIVARLATVRKGMRLLSRPQFVRAMLRNRVAAAIEHLPVIRHTAAATLIDVGANKGQFSLAFRTLRPHAKIVAFEPLLEESDIYAQLFSKDARVKLHRAAIGERDGVAEFHVTDRRDSSSLLRPGTGQSRAFGVTAETNIKVDVKKLETCLSLAELPRPILMKIDVQGAELQVLRGCAALESIDYVYTELSFVELYEGQPLFQEVASYLASRGFELAGVFNQSLTRAYGPTQADFLFARPNIVEES